MSPTEVLPLLVVVILLLAASGVEPDEMTVVFDGDREVASLDEVLVVGGGTVTIPAAADVTGQLYVVGGTVALDGRLDGDVTVLAGNLSVGSGATVTGELQTISGDVDVAPGASVGRLSRLDVSPRPRSPATAAGFLALQVLVLGLAGAVFGRRAPVLLHNLGDAVSHHPVVSGVVGALAGTSMLVLFVYMAFTLVLLPVSIAGLVLAVVLVAYGYLGVGHVVGRRLPVERVDVATGLGTGAVVLALELLGQVPVLGAAVQFAVIVVGLGAVLITYLGLQAFEPPALPG